MDPIAHTFVGAALAQSGLAKRTAYGTAALVLGANLPDIDGVTILVDGDTALLWRRGWTHGLLALVVLPLLLAGLFLLYEKLTRRTSSRDGPPLRPGALLGLSYLAVGTHPSLDWLNNYGMRWLMPFENRWFYGDSVFIVDPWIWLLLGGSVFLFRSRRVSAFVVWTMFAAFASYLLFRFVPELVVAKAVWFVALLLLVVLRFRGVGLDERVGATLARGALVVTAVYIATMVATARYSRRAVAQELADRGLAVERLMVGPVPVTPFVRDVVFESGDAYRHGTARLWPRFELDLTPRSIPRLEDTGPAGRAAASPHVRGFMTWARFPFAEVEEGDSAFVVYLLDARYTRSKTSGFGSARVEVPKPAGPSPPTDSR